MSPATHHMSVMDPCKTDTDEFQQVQFIGFMQEAEHQDLPSFRYFKNNGNRQTFYFWGY
jgi:hypothetical protein